MSKVLTVGTFDLFHPGHVALLRKCNNIATSYGQLHINEYNNVIVGLNTDEFVLRFKGSKPIYTYSERSILLSNSRAVYGVVKNEGEDLKPLIQKVQPQLLIVGSDWAKKDYYAQTSLTKEFLQQEKVTLIYLEYTEGISTTKLKERIIRDG